MKKLALLLKKNKKKVYKIQKIMYDCLRDEKNKHLR